MHLRKPNWRTPNYVANAPDVSASLRKTPDQLPKPCFDASPSTNLGMRGPGRRLAFVLRRLIIAVGQWCLQHSATADELFRWLAVGPRSIADGLHRRTRCFAAPDGI